MADRADLLDRLEAEDEYTVSLTQRAYRRLEEMIVTLQIPPGQVISESELAQRLDIGRTPVREALQRLAREGLVTIMPRRGILVTEFEVRHQLKLLELRRPLESLLVRCSARRATEEERAAFRQIAVGMRQASNQAEEIAYMRLDRKFNLLLNRAVRNEFIANAWSSSRALARRFWVQHNRGTDDFVLSASLQADVCTALAEGDEEAAVAANDKLLEYVEDFTRATLDE